MTYVPSRVLAALFPPGGSGVAPPREWPAVALALRAAHDLEDAARRLLAAGCGDVARAVLRLDFAESDARTLSALDPLPIRLWGDPREGRGVPAVRFGGANTTPSGDTIVVAADATAVSATSLPPGDRFVLTRGEGAAEAALARRGAALLARGIGTSLAAGLLLSPFADDEPPSPLAEARRDRLFVAAAHRAGGLVVLAPLRRGGATWGLAVAARRMGIPLAILGKSADDALLALGARRVRSWSEVADAQAEARSAA